MNPLELAGSYLVPAIMRRLAELLIEEYGLSRVEVAKRIGVSPAAVTRYLKGERAKVLDLKGLGDVDRMIEALAGKVASGEAQGYVLHEEVARIALYALGKRYLCSFHAELDPRVNPASCSLCPDLFKFVGGPLPGK